MLLDQKGSARLALITTILQAANGIEGRTKFQKIAYFANLLGWNCLEDFKFHYYGPFSRSLTDDIEGMRGNGWIYEEAEPTFSDRTIYKYRIAKGKRGVADALVARANDPALVKKTFSLVKTLDKFTSDDLELMATLIFLRRSYPKASSESLLKMTNDLKPRFKMDRVVDASRKLEEVKPFGFTF